MIKLLEQLSRTLAKNGLNARNIAEQLGTIQGGGEPNVPFKVAPADKTVKDIRVVHDSKTGEPSQVILIPAAALPMKKLTAAFGEYSELPMMPNPNEPPRVSFDIDAPPSGHNVSILASYDPEADDPATSDVVKVVVFRD
jgi:hypothetical protein